MTFSDSELFQGFGRSKRFDPRSHVVNDFLGVATLVLGNRASTILVDDGTHSVFIAGNLTKWWKAPFKNWTDQQQADAGYGLHTAVLADGRKGINRKILDVKDQDGNPSVELLKLVEIALQGGASGSSADINLRIANFNLSGSDGPFLEVVVDGRKTSDILLFKGEVARKLLLAFDDFGYARTVDLSNSTSSETVDLSGYVQGTVETGTGNDTITGSAGDDSIRAGGGNDYVYLGAGDDTVFAGAGDDRIIAGQGAGFDFIDGGAGNDFVEYPSCTTGLAIDLRPADRSGAAFGTTTVGAALAAQGYAPTTPVGIASGAQIDTDILLNIENAIGGSGADTIHGNALDNVLGGGGGSDVIFGHGGYDRLLLPGAPGDYQVTYDSVSDDGTFIVTDISGSGASDVRIKDVEVLVFSDAERPLWTYTSYIHRYVDATNSPLIGTPAREILHGDARDNVLIGNEGEDIFIGGAGNDTMDGANANDDANFILETVDYASEEAGGGFQGVVVDLGAGTATDTYGNSDTLIGIERVFGTSHGDFIQGADQTSGSEFFDPHGGDDTIHGGGGRDTLAYHLTERTYGGSSGITVALSTAIAGAGVVTSDPFGFTDTFTGIERIRATEFADLFTGGAGDIELQPLAGADTINAAQGSNVTVTYRNDANYGGNAGVTVRLDGNYAIDGFGDRDVLSSWVTGIEGTGSSDYIQGNLLDNRLEGGNGNDQIYGGAGDDRIGGGAGDDLLAGQAGNDTVTGGDGDDTIVSNGGDNLFFGDNGADEFVFHNAGNTTVLDFSVGTDSLRFGPGISLSSLNETDVNSDGVLDTVLQMDNGLTVNLLSVNGVGGLGPLLGQTLPGSFGAAINGINIKDASGISVSSAGDVNGDGFGDILIGAYAAGPNGLSLAGESYLVFGAAGGFGASLDLAALDGSNGFVLNGAAAGDTSGLSVSSAGDVNGDGIGDILVGAHAADPNGQGNAGESYVVFGSAGGFGASLDLAALDGSNGFVLNGAAAGDNSGFSVSGAGDVNGDGIDDILIGAANADRNGLANAGESHVVLGASGGFGASLDLAALDGSNGFVLNGIAAGGRSGISVSQAGDVNGDGIGDILIGAANAGPNRAGESYVVFGSAGGFGASLDLAALDGSNGFVLNGIAAGDLSGFSVSGAGDVNGDGFDDILIGAYLADSNGQGSAGESYVVFGASGGFGASLDLAALDGSNGFVLNGAAASDRSGISVSQAGDVNGDGVDDILIGAANAGPNGRVNAGESYVVFGTAGGFGASLDLAAVDGSNGFVMKGIAAGDTSGISVSQAGDMNGDGYDDLLIGAQNADPNGVPDAGETYLIYGGPDILHRFDFADGTRDGSIELALLAENPANYDLPIS